MRVVGLLSTSTGIGQSARLCIASARQQGYDVSTCNLSPLFGVDHKMGVDARNYPDQPVGLTFFHFNPPLMLLAMIASGLGRYYRGTNVAYWAWELPVLPPEWLVALRYVDAVMVPSTYCRDIVARHTDKPVLVVAHPVTAAIGTGSLASKRAAQSPFRVLSVFNCGSSLYRKNPFAAIDAFKAAFGDDPEAELLLKISDGAQHKADVALLQQRIAGSSNIRIVDKLMSPDELDDLLRSADAYISLHRSEGFGLTIAEAILREVPVVVTGWSGNADFCPPDLAWVVDHSLVPVNDPHPAYCDVAAAVWAEPSIKDAAGNLVAIRANLEGARNRAVALRRHLIAHIERHSYASAIEALIAARRSP